MQQYQRTTYDFGQSITWPWHMHGGRNFLFRVVIWGGAFLLLVYAVFGRQFISAYAEFLQMAFELDAGGEPSDEDVMNMFGSLGGFFGSIFIVSVAAWLVSIAMETAMHKNTLRGTDHGMMPLRLGVDEMRVWLVQFVVILIVFGAYFAGILIMAILFALAAGLGGGAGAAIGGLLAIIAIFGAMIMMVMLAIRLAPAASMTVRDNTIRIFEAWKISRKHAWSMLGSYVVIGLIGYIVLYVVMLVGLFISFGNGEFLQVLNGSFEDDPQTLFAALGEQLQRPRVFIPLVITTVIYAFATMLWYLHIWAVGNYVTCLDTHQRDLFS